MTEALCAVLAYAVAEVGCERISAYCDTANLASARVMQKAGMRYVEVVPKFSVHPNIGPEWRDCFRYDFP